MTTLAIDIGGTKIAAAVCDANDSIIQRWRVPTPMDADAINKHIAEIYREAIAAGDKAAAEAAYKVAAQKLDKAAGAGVIHRNQAANRKSGLAVAINAL